MIEVIKPPTYNYDKPDSYTGEASAKKRLFIAGGISGCPRWDNELIKWLNKFDIADDLVIYNPRREDFNVYDKGMSEAQIKWEHWHLKDSDIISFWFPKETLCPITLFELGIALKSEKKVIVGIDPDYKRKFDLEIQIPLYNQDINICKDLYKLAYLIAKELET